MCAKYNHLHSGYDYIIVFIGEQENRAGIYDVKLIIHRSCIDLSQILCVKIVFARHLWVRHTFTMCFHCYLMARRKRLFILNNINCYNICTCHVTLFSAIIKRLFCVWLVGNCCDFRRAFCMVCRCMLQHTKTVNTGLLLFNFGFGELRTENIASAVVHSIFFTTSAHCLVHTVHRIQCCLIIMARQKQHNRSDG